jgi:hypothetical protein
MNRKYKFPDPAGIYFVTFSAVNRIDVFFGGKAGWMRSLKLLLLLLFLFFFISCLSDRKKKETIDVPVEHTVHESGDESITDFDIHLLSDSVLTRWLAHYRSANSDFSLDRFKPLERSEYYSGFYFDYEYTIDKIDTSSVFVSLYEYSPSGNYYIDLNSFSDIISEEGVYKGSDIDSQAHLVDVRDKQVVRIACYGSWTGCDDFFWHDDSIFVLLGNEIDYDNSDTTKPFLVILNTGKKVIAYYDYEENINRTEVSYRLQRLISKGIKIAVDGD